MKAPMNLHFAVFEGRLRGRPRPASWIIVAAGLLAGLTAGCPGGTTGSPAPGVAAIAGSSGFAQPGAPSAAGSPAALPAPGAQAIVYTASLTVRAADISRAASLGERIATADGGHVSNGTT